MSKFSILVNREHLLPETYIPSRLTEPSIPFSAPPGDKKRLLVKDAATAAEELFSRAGKEGIRLCGVSGYRPYSRQQERTGLRLKKERNCLGKPGKHP